MNSQTQLVVAARGEKNHIIPEKLDRNLFEGMVVPESVEN